MANSSSPPLCERIEQKHTVQRSLETIITLLLSLLVYRLLSFKDHGFTWLLAFLCELYFTLHWVLNVITKWTPVDYKTYPDRLLQWVPELLPPVDMFVVTTADPVLEPTIITLNTVLSLLAVDYPANKLACYVSDDGCSPLTLYSLIEASKFAKLWVPFCKKYNFQVRAPFRCFSCKSVLPGDHSPGFQIEWKKMKDEYQKLEGKLEYVAQNSMPYDHSSEFVPFKNIESRNHPTIIKVILENKGGHSNELPHLVYISREKRSNLPHHCKAGAMNVLTRVSGLRRMHLMLNVDCDMFANNPQIVLHTMCLMLGFEHESDCAFVQCLQIFYDVPKDDPFGSQMLASLETVGHGMGGIQGPCYAGTGCFHRRKIIYALSLNNADSKGTLSEKALEEQFGNSIEFVKSASQILSGLDGKTNHPHDIPSPIEAAYQVANCGYERDTAWGNKVQEPASYLFVALFFICNLYNIFVFLQLGLSIRACWNHLRMNKITSACAQLFGVLSVILKLLGLSETVFEVTKKDQFESSDSDNVDAGSFTFDESPIFILGSTLLMVQLSALVMGLLGLQPPAQGVYGSGLGEVMCSVFVVLCFWPFVKGLFRKGKYGIPLSIICNSTALALLFVLLSRRASIG